MAKNNTSKTNPTIKISKTNSKKISRTYTWQELVEMYKNGNNTLFEA